MSALSAFFCGRLHDDCAPADDGKTAESELEELIRARDAREERNRAEAEELQQERVRLLRIRRELAQIRR